MKVGKNIKKACQLLFVSFVIFGVSTDSNANTKVCKTGDNSRVEVSKKYSSDSRLEGFEICGLGKRGHLKERSNNIFIGKQDAIDYIKNRLLNFDKSIKVSYESGNEGDRLNKHDIEAIRNSINKTPGMYRILESLDIKTGGRYFVTNGKTLYRFRVDIDVDYRITKKQRQQYLQKVDEWVLKNINKSMSDEEKVKTIHDWVVNNSVYTLGNITKSGVNVNKKGINVYSPEAIMLTSKTDGGTCEAYAGLFYDLAKKSGLEVYNVIGNTKSKKNIGNEIKYKKVGHIWNLVKVNGRWYHIDVTMDDPVYIIVSNSGEYRKNVLSYDYYLKTDSFMKQGNLIHEWNKVDNPNMPNVSNKNYPQKYKNTM